MAAAGSGGSRRLRRRDRRQELQAAVERERARRDLLLGDDGAVGDAPQAHAAGVGRRVGEHGVRRLRGAQAADAAQGALERLALALQACRLLERQALDHDRLALLEAAVDVEAVALEHAAHRGDGVVVLRRRRVAGRARGRRRCRRARRRARPRRAPRARARSRPALPVAGARRLGQARAGAQRVDAREALDEAPGSRRLAERPGVVRAVVAQVGRRVQARVLLGAELHVLVARAPACRASCSAACGGR